MPQPAWGQAAPVDINAARALFGAAEADEQAQRWPEALEKLRRAATARMTPGIRFHIALCEEKMGKIAAALADYGAAQAAARETNNREVLGLVSEPLLALKLRVPTVTVRLPAGLHVGSGAVEIRLDGAPLAASSVGTPLPVEVGAHTVQATGPAQRPFAMSFVLREQQAESLLIPFDPPPGPPDASPTVAPLVPGAPSEAPAGAPSSAGRRARPLAFIATAGAVVLVAGGLGAYAAAGSDQSSYQTTCSKPGSGLGCGNATVVRTWDAVALGAWIAAAGTAGAAVVLWTRPGATSTDGGRALLQPGPGSVWVTGRF